VSDNRQRLAEIAGRLLRGAELHGMPREATEIMRDAAADIYIVADLVVAVHPKMMADLRKAAPKEKADGLDKR
jgi:hypothetical protein